MGLYRDIAPAIPVLARLEERGIPLHTPTQEAMRASASARLEAACAAVQVLAQDYHTSRLQRVRDTIQRLEEQRDTMRAAIPACPEHPDYFGKSRRKKSMCCMYHFDLVALQWAAVRDLHARVQKGRAKIEQLGTEFNARNDNHWRFLLFDELGLRLTPTSYTDLMTPQVNEHAFEILRRRYPDIELLRLQVDIQETKTRLNTRLAVLAETDGRVHTPYSIHRTWNMRVSSGNDDSEAEEIRAGMGNLQNVPKRDRMMYRAEPGKIFVQPDLSQVEARVQAWLARDVKMLSAWRDGLDIHAMTAAAIYNVPEAETKTRLVRIAGHMEPMRQMGKKRRHGGNYGMGDAKFADMTGITLDQAHAISAADRLVWPRLYAFQKEEIERASRDRYLRNPFGYMVRFYSWRQRNGQWEIADREEALSFRPASTVGCMIIMMLAPVDAVASGELLTTTHDSYLAQVDNDRDRVIHYVAQVRGIMSREWPQLGPIEGFGYFRCPVDFKIGFNWGDKHDCKPGCANRRAEYPDEPCDDHNPDGLEDYDKWMTRC